MQEHAPRRVIHWRELMGYECKLYMFRVLFILCAVLAQPLDLCAVHLLIIRVTGYISSHVMM